jgi:hypothetical protein
MGDMADYSIDLAYTSEFSEYQNTNSEKFLETLGDDQLIEMMKIYVDEGYIRKETFPYKMVLWYDEHRWLSPAQRDIVVNTLSMVPRINEVHKFYHQPITMGNLEPTLENLTEEFQCNESNNYGMSGSFYAIETPEGYFTMFTLACGSANIKICRHENMSQAVEMADDYNRYSGEM